MKSHFEKISLILYFLSVGANSQLFPVQPGSHKFYVTEFVRVKRQAGYVYNRPNMSFDLPSRPSNTPTQKKNVDRIQEQHMYYAYPVPSSGNAAKTESSSSVSGTQSGSSVGYNYGAQSNKGVTQTTSTSGSSKDTGGATSSQTVSGYNYNSPGGSVNSGQASSSSSSSSTATSSVSVGYGYNTPSNSETGANSLSQSNSKDIQTSSGQVGAVSAGYGYNTPSSSSRQSSLQTKSGYSLTETNAVTNGFTGYETPSIVPGRQSNLNLADSTASVQAAAKVNTDESNANSFSPGYAYGAPPDRGHSSKSGSTATSSVSTTYNYEPPADNNQKLIDTSTSAPQYLPPINGAKTDYSQSNSGSNYASNIDISSIGGSTDDFNKGSGSLSTNVKNLGVTSGVQTSVSNGGENGYAKEDGNGGSNILGNNVNIGSNVESLADGTRGFTSGSDAGGVSVSGYSALGGGLNTGVTGSFALAKPSNTYIAPSTLSGNTQVPTTSQVAIGFSSSSSNNAQGVPASKPTSTYIPQTNSPNLSTRVPIAPSQTYSPISNSRTEPSKTYIPASGSEFSNKQVQAYLPPVKQSTLVVVQPSGTYLPQNMKSTDTPLNPPSRSYVQQPQRLPEPASPPSQTYVPQSTLSTQPISGPPSLNYVPQSLGPSSPIQSSDITDSVNNAKYLPPNPSSGSISNSGSLQPTANYLPPTSNSISRQQSPSATYLPPVFRF